MKNSKLNYSIVNKQEYSLQFVHYFLCINEFRKDNFQNSNQGVTALLIIDNVIISSF